MEIENLFNEWSIAYRAKGGKITVSAEELFADFFRWLKSKAAEQSVQSDKGKLPHLGNPCVFCGISKNTTGAVLGVCPCR